MNLLNGLKERINSVFYFVEKKIFEYFIVMRCLWGSDMFLIKILNEVNIL